MRKIILCLSLLMLFAFEFVEETPAQSVPQSVKREISKQLSCKIANMDISSVKIGSGKSGYIGKCNDAYIVFLYEKTARGIKKLYEGESQMNGSISLGKKAYRGYYEVINEMHGLAYLGVETFRWNGSRFVSHKCESCDIDSRGKIKNCKPC